MPNQGFWIDGLKGTADRLNAALLQYDTYANIPAAGQTGRLFLATDTGLLYRDNGVSWDLVPRVVLTGQNNTEATSTSTSAGDRVVVSGLSIPTTCPVLIMANLRKSAGHASACYFGLKVNSTVVMEADTASIGTSALNQAGNGLAIWILGPQVANYLRAGVCIHNGSPNWDGSAMGKVLYLHTADMPNATITSIAIRGISANALNTHGVDEVRVFRLGG